ncbi:uncharacterized protein DUF3990 [Cricetibacter osteomyelitidis]|uniref:Uncharacterized protein DUF3990 n=1 Tax=Cricetibacter osteomyelitidis TaxID=1521931 RepID=A0A4R2TM98_9PAST|nr:DUF3990 domain-containing protein [Cricetibacter osteomyelitidis]TCP96012.1 uncharacterized protein DUF3990 [Cricetibacter osteomyelitidis]
MRLYHGSNEKIIRPDLNKGRNPLDFGAEFYLTSDRQQAVQWAVRKTERLSSGIPIVNMYEFAEAEAV